MTVATTLWPLGTPRGRVAIQPVASRPAASATQVLGVGQTISPAFARAAALSVDLVWDEDQWLALEPVTQMFGEGGTPLEAYEDLMGSLRSYRESLKAGGSRLAPRLLGHLELLEATLGR
jgi:hypothetical protein